MIFATFSPIARARRHMAARIAVAVFGGYAFSAAIVALLAVSLPQFTGMARSEAVLLASMVGFIIYLIAVIWVFAASRLWLVCTVFAGGAVGSAALIFAIKRVPGAA